MDNSVPTDRATFEGKYADCKRKPNKLRHFKIQNPS